MTPATESVSGLAAATLDLLPQSHQVEAYLATRSDATFTHGICQDCSGRAHLAAERETAIAPPPNGRLQHPTAP